MMRFWNNLRYVRSKSRLERKITLSFGTNKTKGSKQDSQNRIDGGWVSSHCSSIGTRRIIYISTSVDKSSSVINNQRERDLILLRQTKQIRRHH